MAPRGVGTPGGLPSALRGAETVLSSVGVMEATLPVYWTPTGPRIFSDSQNPLNTANGSPSAYSLVRGPF